VSAVPLPSVQLDFRRADPETGEVGATQYASRARSIVVITQPVAAWRWHTIGSASIDRTVEGYGVRHAPSLAAAAAA
jgi:hypothetical protein